METGTRRCDIFRNLVTQQVEEVQVSMQVSMHESREQKDHLSTYLP